MDQVSFDLIINHALIIDGSAKQPFVGSLAVSNGRIAQIEPGLQNNLNQAATKHRIEANGLALMPGIIDSHTHYDAQITWDAYLSQSVQMGVTTALIGNCGFTIAPCTPANRDLVMKNLTQVEGMSLDSLREGIDWSFETFPEYLDLIEKKGCAINLAAFVGHSTLRTHVMGGAASDRAATPDEVNEMRQLLAQAMRAGAVGFATTTSTSHSAYDGRPMPSRLAAEEEINGLLDTLKIEARGSFMLTKGPATPTPTLMQWAKRCERPFLVAALLHSHMAPDGVFDDLKTIGEASAKGIKVKGAVATTPLSFDFNFLTPYPLEPLKAWKPHFGAKGETLKSALHSHELRQQLRDELANPGRRLFSGDWDLVHLLDAHHPKFEKFEHQTVEAIAQALGKDPLDTMFDIALESNLEALFSVVSLNHDEAAVSRLLTHPNSLVSLSDAGAHLSFLDESGFGLHLMGYWARDKKIMDLAQAVYRLTQAQAEFFGIKNRGSLKVGYQADLLMFDPANVGRQGKKRLNDLPAKATRVATQSRGVYGVWVNGERVANADGALCTAKPGQLLREFAV